MSPGAREVPAGEIEAQDAAAALPLKQARAVAVLLAGGTVEEAARAAGVRRQRISEWRRDPRFAEALNAGRREIVERARDGLGVGFVEAVGALRTLAANGHAGAAAKLAEIGSRITGLDTGARVHVSATATVAPPAPVLEPDRLYQAVLTMIEEDFRKSDSTTSREWLAGQVLALADRIRAESAPATWAT